jgi:hypothetical protein
MRTFYFVGGPLPGREGEFFRRLELAGGSPSGWLIYPHLQGDGQALHVVTADSEQEILDHLDHFGGIYSHTEIVEVRSPIE